ncbi:Cellobiose 2-epimerase [bacterium HR19]|nr:Cellobiose 2-epimerase [bacterium HR19]
MEKHDLNQNIQSEIIKIIESKPYVLQEPPKGKNRLYFEVSPYLKQHEDNPVDWYPWCKEAFEKAQKENKPIFVSIGYSTCHWCHVMERESFSNPEIAELINKYFVPIKIDREERPDLDRIFMLICEITIRNCGWPLNIVLTPNGLPIFVATYIPPNSKGGMIGMKELIPKIAEIWREKKNEIEENGKKIVEVIKNLNNEIFRASRGKKIDKDITSHSFDVIKSYFDEDYGGFGYGQKFPNVPVLIFLLKFWNKTKNQSALYIVEKTLDSMANGGIYDHIGGGFHRYTVDRKWLIPHFEKMLYDQALLILIYSQAYKVLKKERYREVVSETINYLFENLYDDETGGFFSAEDAESEGEEGKFYLWDYEEIKKICTDEELEIIQRHFGISPYGNNQSFPQKNVIHISLDTQKLSEIYKRNKDEIERIIRKVKRKMKDEREKRTRPFKDTKILTDWNALTIIALTQAYHIIDDKNIIQKAEKTSKFLTEKMTDENGKLYHVYKDGKRGVTGMLEDYSFFILALIELYFSNLERYFVEKSIYFAEEMIKTFYDEQIGLFRNQNLQTDFVFTRPVDIFDHSIPSGNSVALESMLKLYKLTGKEKFLKISERMIESILYIAEENPLACSYFIQAMELFSGKTTEIAIVGKKEDAITFIREFQKRYIPNYVIALIEDDRDREIFFAKDFRQKEGKTTIYICSNFVCKEPKTDINDAIRLLDDSNL